MDYSYESLQTVSFVSSDFEAYDSQKEDINIFEAWREAREERKMLEYYLLTIYSIGITCTLL